MAILAKDNRILDSMDLSAIDFQNDFEKDKRDTLILDLDIINPQYNIN
jgi:hypothetical protein